jgi:lipopolysaccharide biosynthesis glycosyltransferase
MKGADMHDPITVVFASDNNYCQHLAVTILSLIEKNENEVLHLIVMSIGINKLHKDRLGQIVEGKPLVSLQFVELDSSSYRHFRVDGHISWAAYARIFIPELVSPEIRKVLYLDCDLYVADSIRPLWQTDITAYPLAAVPVVHDAHKKSLGIPDDKNYVNSGVLLMNLDLWRSRNLTGKLIDYIENNAGLLKNWDQDALNAVLFDQIYALDPRWNVSNRIFKLTAEELKLRPEEHQSLKDKPGIVHFTTDYKPWDYLNPNPFTRHYWRILKTTPYRDYRPPLRSALKRLPPEYRPRTLLGKLWPKKGG